MFVPLFVTVAVASLATAQTSAPRRTVWDGVYTEAQSARGITAFGQSCSGLSYARGGRQIAAGWRTILEEFRAKERRRFIEFVSANMPNGAPGSLSESTYRDIVALMLKSNGFPAGTTELRRDSIAGVQIVRKDGSTELPAEAFVRVVGCLARNGADWVVTKATTPERAERVAQSTDDSTRPLGSRTIPLKFVVTHLDPLTGSRVAVSGLLIGAGGADGINVTAVSRVAPKCP